MANLEAVHLEALVGGVLGSLQEKFGGGDAVVADEVRRERKVGPTFDVFREVLELLR